jgi:hypothetical protein
VTSPGNDSAEIVLLFEPGAVFAGVLEPLAPAVTTTELVSDIQTPASSVTEPGTMGLLGGALFLPGVFVTGRRANFKTHGALLRAD